MGILQWIKYTVLGCGTEIKFDENFIKSWSWQVLLTLQYFNNHTLIYDKFQIRGFEICNLVTLHLDLFMIRIIWLKNETISCHGSSHSIIISCLINEVYMNLVTLYLDLFMIRIIWLKNETISCHGISHSKFHKLSNQWGLHEFLLCLAWCLN